MINYAKNCYTNCVQWASGVIKYVHFACISTVYTIDINKKCSINVIVAKGKIRALLAAVCIPLNREKSALKLKCKRAPIM